MHTGYQWGNVVCLSYFGLGRKIKFELMLKEVGSEWTGFI